MILTRDFIRLGAFETQGEFTEVEDHPVFRQPGFHFNVGILEYFMAFEPLEKNKGDNPRGSDPYRVDFALSGIKGTREQQIELLTRVLEKDLGDISDRIRTDEYKFEWYKDWLLTKGFDSLTDVGNPMQVLSIVFNKVKEFVNKQKPPWMLFSASGRTSSEIARKTNIYKKIIKQMFPRVRIRDFKNEPGDFSAYFKYDKSGVKNKVALH